MKSDTFEKVFPWFMGGIAVMIVFVFITIIGSIALNFVNQFVDQKPTAEKVALEFADKMMPGHGPLTCMNRDTDADGYINCVVQKQDGTNVPLECTGTQYGTIRPNHGCRIPSLKVAQ